MDKNQVEAETRLHIRQVQILIKRVCDILKNRGIVHDESKLKSPELETFQKYTEKLKGVTYGSNEYKKFLADMKPALDHHYANNRHHPEHFEDGIKGMNLIDLMEMFCDWYAATKRHADGDINKSIEINKKRFGYGDEIEAIFLNTVRDTECFDLGN